MITKGKNGQYLVVVEKGRQLVETIQQAVEQEGMLGGMISGLGALTNVDLGYFNSQKREYQHKVFADEYELLHLSGNISRKDGGVFVHVHALISDANYQTFGGHLFDATVAITAEVYITPLGVMPVREAVPEIGLHLICKCE